MQKVKNISDEELIVLVREKDQELYAEIVERYQEKLLRYIKYLIGNDQKAADVVQDTFIKAFINLNGFDTKKRFSSWIYRIGHNEAMNAIKKYHREIRFDEKIEVADKNNLEEEFDKKQISEMINNCINTIPVKYSESIVLYFLEEKSYEEISDILRIPMGTVATRINRGKALMKKICKNKK